MLHAGPGSVVRAFAALMLLARVGGGVAVAAPIPAAGTCEHGRIVERALGSNGYRVVVGGGYRVRDDEPVKVQVWENEARDWVITEAFLKENRTCVVRSGIRLHMMY